MTNINDEIELDITDKQLLLKQKDLDIQKKDSDWNAYATSKSVSQSFLNTTTITSQITLLVLLFAAKDGPFKGFQIALIVLISASLLLQFIIYVLLVILAQAKDEQITKSCTATFLNGIVTSLTGLLMIISAAITAVTLNADITSKPQKI